MTTRIALLLMLCPLLVAANDTYEYSWENNRQRYNLSAEELHAPEIILKDHFEYAYRFENNQFIMYSVVHRIVRVNNNEAIQRHNRISISLQRTLEVVEVKARSINPQNKVVLFDKNNLKEVSEDGSGDRIFAMEGVELGSEIEYYYVRKMAPNAFSTAYLQMDVPIKRVSFVLKCPRHLEFDFKSYNGLPEAQRDTTATENVYSVSIDDVPAARGEAFSFSHSAKHRVEYKLAFNRARSAARMYTWDDAGKEFYSNLYQAGKDDPKSIEKFVRTLTDDPSKSLAARIRSIERQVKTTIQLEEDRSDESLSDVATIARVKVASKHGMTRFFLRVFEAKKIAVQPVMTSSREYAHFDESFDTWSYLDEYLLYFPDANGFMSPYKLQTTFPLAEAEYMGQKGLFIEPIEIGTLKSGLATIKEIPAAPYNLSMDNLDIDVSFDASITGNEVNLRRFFRGYNAMYFAPYYNILSEQQRLAMIDELVKQTAPGVTIKKWKADANFESDVDEFYMDVNFTTSHFVERAGPRILFKLGLLIGPQSELYSEDKRVHPVENTYNRGYERVIRVNIPDGYTIKNPGDMNFDVVYKDGDKVPFSFQSSYTLDGNRLTVKITEYYKEIFAPLERYEDYRKVINAAADFNKVTLVLEKR